MVKLVWSLAIIVIVIGLVRLVVVYRETHTADRDIVIRKSE